MNRLIDRCTVAVKDIPTVTPTQRYLQPNTSTLRNALLSLHVQLLHHQKDLALHLQIQHRTTNHKISTTLLRHELRTTDVHVSYHITFSWFRIFYQFPLPRLITTFGLCALYMSRDSSDGNNAWLDLKIIDVTVRWKDTRLILSRIYSFEPIH